MKYEKPHLYINTKNTCKGQIQSLKLSNITNLFYTQVKGLKRFLLER
jgi:hypothetical protein